MKVTVAVAGPSLQREVAVEVEDGATVFNALAASGITADSNGGIGVWGKVRPLDYRLREGDRVEIYRPLTADPKDARRVRAKNK